MICAAAFLAFVLPLSAWAQAGDVQLTLAEATREFYRGPAYASTEHDLSALELEFSARDLLLEPQLELSASRYRDRRESFTTLGKTEAQVMSATLHKPFSTGTDLYLTPRWERALFPATAASTQSDFYWEVGMSQNLWQDFFGRSTRQRWQREDFEKRQLLAGILLKRALLLIDFEAVYWDWAFALREVELRSKNHKRSVEIFTWVRGRFQRSAAESTDLLQARALMTNRELQLAAAKESLLQAGVRVQRYVPGARWRPRVEDLGVDRPVEEMLSRWPIEKLASPLKLELLAAQGEALATSIKAEEARESTRPQLALELAYGRNGVDPSVSSAARQSINETHEYTSASLVLRTGLDLGREQKKVEAARALKAAAEARRGALESEGSVAWLALQGQVRDLRSRIAIAKNLLETQVQKNEAEKQRHRTGRATAFEAITFEQDAADAELNLWTLNSLARKAESQAHLYAR